MSAIFALACAAVYGVADYCGGRATRRSDVFAVTLLAQLCGLLTIVALLPLFGDGPPPLADWLWGMAAGAGGVIGLLAFYHAMGHGAMTVVAPVTAMVSSVVPVVVGLAIGERPGALALAGMALAVVAVALVSGLGGEANGATTSRILLAAAIGGAGFGVSFIGLDQVETDTIWPLVGFRMASLPMLLIAAALLRRPLMTLRPDRSTAIIAGVLDMFANLLFLLATRSGLLTVTSVLASLYPVSTVVLALRVDRERVTRLQGIGMVLALGALIVVALGRA